MIDPIFQRTSRRLFCCGLCIVMGCGAENAVPNPQPIRDTQAQPQPAAPVKVEPVEELTEPKTADLFQAASRGNVNDVKFYVRKDPEALNRANENGMYPIHLAAMNGHDKVLQVLLKAGADVNTPHSRVQATPLQYAATGGHIEAARALLDAKANVNAKDSEGRTPLAWAATSARTAMAKLLLERGADASLAAENGMTPIHQAANVGDTKLLEALVQGGVDVNMRHPRVQATPLQYAATGGHIEAARALLDARANVNATDNAGRTPLMWAASKGQTAIVKLLLERGADAKQKTPNGWTALKYAEKEKHAEIVELLNQQDSKDREAG